MTTNLVAIINSRVGESSTGGTWFQSAVGAGFAGGSGGVGATQFRSATGRSEHRDRAGARIRGVRRQRGRLSLDPPLVPGTRIPARRPLLAERGTRTGDDPPAFAWSRSGGHAPAAASGRTHHSRGRRELSGAGGRARPRVRDAR